MTGRAAALLILGMCAAALAADLPPLPPETPSNILQFLHGIKDVPDRQNVVIRDAAALARYWDAKKGKPPAVDFAKNVVLLATLGRTPATAGRAVSIVTAEKLAGGALRAQVVIAQGEPATADETQADYPYCAVVVEKPAGQVFWAPTRTQELKIRGDAPGFDEYPSEATAVIRSLEAEKHYWAGASGAMPKVDFARYTLLGAFRGKVATTGHDVRIVALRFADGELTAFVSQSAPPDGAPMAPIPGAPGHVVAIDRWDGPVRFIVSRAAAKPAPEGGKDVRDIFNK